MGITDILLIILILVAIALGIYLIITLKKFNAALSNMESAVDDFRTRLNPILDNLQEVTEKANNVVNIAEQEVKAVGSSIKDVRKTISMLSLKNIKTKAANPVIDLIDNLSAISKGVAAFWHRLKS